MIIERIVLILIHCECFWPQKCDTICALDTINASKLMGSIEWAPFQVAIAYHHKEDNSSKLRQSIMKHYKLRQKNSIIIHSGFCGQLISSLCVCTVFQKRWSPLYFMEFCQIPLWKVVKSLDHFLYSVSIRIWQVLCTIDWNTHTSNFFTNVRLLGKFESLSWILDIGGQPQTTSTASRESSKKACKKFWKFLKKNFCLKLHNSARKAKKISRPKTGGRWGHLRLTSDI